MTNVSPAAQAISDMLEEAQRLREPCPRPASLTMEIAPQVRAARIASLERSGQIGAYKVSLSTSTWGALPAERVVPDGTTLRRDALFDPLLEAELVFRVERDLPPGCPIDALLESCSVAVAVEVADSRWQGWQPSKPDAFQIPDAAQIEADNAVAGWLVVGGPWQPAAGLPLAEMAVVTRSGGMICAQGPLRDVMGGPGEALRWLAGQLEAAGRPLRAGQLVSSGCPCHELVTVPASGGEWTVTVDGLGQVTVRFT